MKKIYQIPETEVIISEYTKYILGEQMSGEIGPGHNESNEGRIFNEGEISTDMTKSGLWDE